MTSGSTRIRGLTFSIGLCLVGASFQILAANPSGNESSVRGRDDQPRVLFIVPWQVPESRGKAEMGAAPTLADNLRPITAEELSAHRQFRRTLDLKRKPVTLE